MKSISISLVLYQSDVNVLTQTLESLVKSVLYASDQNAVKKAYLIIIDNGKNDDYYTSARKIVNTIWQKTGMPVCFKYGHGNVGYGKGHNIGIFANKCCYHLVINPDVIIKQDSLLNALTYMENNYNVGLLVPKVFHKNGDQLYLIKRYPSLIILLIRGFLPLFRNETILKKNLEKKIRYHNMLDKDWEKTQILDDELVCGCFMLFRKNYLYKINGFSNDFFLYFEDYDLSKRLSKITKIAYTPDVQITHLGGGVVKKGLWHIHKLLRSSITFYTKYGWKIY